ncbi:NAD(P)/FAD-dependent oxidoreductase [Streptomyces demainii]|uniref:2-polyprenyl-6-methoxyphenol hydroxylase-like FAD-dependent oxidoreductase n=1 Tax=Streptomyces demainii TaxID=588122 RepID=A0ABT9KWV1_9ACTN|nr:hypothetical protein [Streptomyces demainii]MDP9612914.1 2-polyprenyl-6-methoxyphenol hydroxylase-like FAD-dependent oxidoreductase [Streptomyces demainii]
MERAVVLGGSYAGLLAARILSSHAAEVLIVEQDILGGETVGRGAPHRRQLHVLLDMGRVLLERFFPGITEELVRDGAHLGTGSTVKLYIGDVMKIPADNSMISATRPFLEDHIRRRVLALPNVKTLTARAHDLVSSGGRISGVRVSSPGDSPAPATQDTLEADLVVDAMGRSTRLGKWLEQHGWQQAPLDRLKLDLGYATAFFHRGDELPDTVIAQVAPNPSSRSPEAPGNASVALAAVEGKRWAVALTGYATHRPGGDPEQFRDFMRQSVLPLRELAECDMVGGVENSSFKESWRRDFTRLSRFPRGLVVIGDAMASVNPLYGQGLTLAALQASALSAYLQSKPSPHDAAWGYFRRAAAVVNVAWQMATFADLAQPHVTGPYPRGYEVLRRVNEMVTAASISDSRVNQVLMDVLHLRTHPKALTRPTVLLRAAQTLLCHGQSRIGRAG